MRRALTVLALLTACPAVHAQENQLTPTDVMEGAGALYFTVRPRVTFGQGTLDGAAFDLDIDLMTFDVLLEGGIGLGKGFEVEIAIPYQFSGTTEGDGTLGILDVETQQESSGFGDLAIVPQYRLVKGSETQPQWVAGLVLVAPTGNDKRGDTEVKLAGVTVADGEDGAIGQGVWKIGVQSAISFKLSNTTELYFLGSYVVGGERERNGIDEDRADIGTIGAGLELHASPTVAIDLRASLGIVGEDVTEDDLAEQTEESHLTYSLQAQVYASLGPKWTLVIGGGLQLIEDHTVDEEGGTDLSDGLTYQFAIGFHFCYDGR